jgi:hypothetical protein
MPRFELWRFRRRDPITGKWVRARYRATLAELEQRYGVGEYQTFGPPEVRDVDADAHYSYFNPTRPNPALHVNGFAVPAIPRPAHCRRLALVGIAQ